MHVADRVNLDQAERALGPRWPWLCRVGALAADFGSPAHLVGGPVRDLLLRASSAWDLDLVVQGDAPRLGDALVGELGGTLRVHGTFRTATWSPPSSVGLPAVDLVSARAEVYPEPASLPVVRPAPLLDDLRRRDFTVNAMALALAPDDLGRLSDPCGGLTDLAAGRLRVLHAGSFHDDPTRALRAARFAARLGLRADDLTLSALSRSLGDGALQALGVERLGHELDLLLREPRVPAAFALLRRWGWLRAWRPWRGDPVRALERSLLRRRELGAGDPVEVGWAALARAAVRAHEGRLVPGPRHRQALWTASPARVAEAEASLSVSADRGAWGEALHGLAEAELVSVSVAWPEPVRWWLTEARHRPLAVDGDDLLGWGHRPGPAFGPALRAARRLAWTGADPDAQRRAAEALLTPPRGSAPS